MGKNEVAAYQYEEKDVMTRNCSPTSRPDIHAPYMFHTESVAVSLINKKSVVGSGPASLNCNLFPFKIELKAIVNSASKGKYNNVGAAHTMVVIDYKIVTVNVWNVHNRRLDLLRSGN